MVSKRMLPDKPLICSITAASTLGGWPPACSRASTSEVNSWPMGMPGEADARRLPARPTLKDGRASAPSVAGHSPWRQCRNVGQQFAHLAGGFVALSSSEAMSSIRGLQSLSR